MEPTIVKVKNSDQHAVVSPDGTEMGRFARCPDDGGGWFVWVPDGNGKCVIRLPNRLPTRAAARAAINEHHTERE